jgi:hypothetical protein
MIYKQSVEAKKTGMARFPEKNLNSAFKIDNVQLLQFLLLTQLSSYEMTWRQETTCYSLQFGIKTLFNSTKSIGALMQLSLVPQNSDNILTTMYFSVSESVLSCF